MEKLWKFYPVKTICMHGSPLSKLDNLDLWKKYDYRDFGIIAKPYFDVDFDEVFYLTDTGQRDGWKVSIRDKVGGQRAEDGRQDKGKNLRAKRAGRGIILRGILLRRWSGGGFRRG